jgi:hypothetical protein
MIHSNKPDLSWELRADHLRGVLRVDQIRNDTLVQLVASWSDPDARDEIIAALDDLAEVVSHERREGELDAAIEQVEDAAGMDTAHVEVDMQDVRRLLAENAEVDRVTGRFRGRGASEIKHPSMRATRAHLKAHPFPKQDRRAS